MTGTDLRWRPVIEAARRVAVRGEPVRAVAVRSWRWVRRQRPASLPGAVLGVGFLCASLTPSLLPRTWLIQGLVSGFSATTGYAIGAAAGWVGGKLVRAGPGPRVRKAAWRVLAVAAVPSVGILLYQGSRWQRDLYRLMGERSPTRPGYLRVILVTVVLFAIAMVVARSLRAAAREAARQLGRWIPAGAARATGGVLVALLSLGLLNTAVYDPVMAAVMSYSEAVNDRTGPPIAQPASPSRSGSPQSAVTWASLGLQGREFVAGGPTPAQLRAFNRALPLPPIRVYAGEQSAPDVHSAAALAVEELWRTGGFSRKVLCVITTTGTGWVDPRAAEALEYLYNGDTALVAIQYSVLPSWLSFAVERKKAEDAGRELFNQVYEQWATLPADRRPKLVTFGESLGTLGGEAAFDSLADLLSRVDGVVWAGSTEANDLWAHLVAHRDPGSSAVRPVYDQGRVVRFASTPADLSGGLPPRVVYLNHASDPITWWTPDLLVRRPDWLTEPRGSDVLPAMRWYPFVTFWQVTADLMFADHAPDGHGHHYGGEFAVAWAAILHPAGWTAQDTERLSALINRGG
jgi:uncharacterized membrane protein